MLAADLQRLDDVAAEGDLNADVFGVAAVCPLAERHVDGGSQLARTCAPMYTLAPPQCWVSIDSYGTYSCCGPLATPRG